MGVSRLKMAKQAKNGGGGTVAKAEAPAGGNAAAQAKQAENDSFNRHYNKELKVSEGKQK